MVSSADGRCNCGQVAFEVRADLKDIYVCHCSVCRRWSGGNGVAVVIVPKKNFIWLSGEDYIKEWSKPDADWKSWFCKICGSALPGENDDETIFIPAGLLSSGGENLRVAHHIWVGSKARWDEIGDEGRQHEKAFSPSRDGDG